MVQVDTAQILAELSHQWHQLVLTASRPGSIAVLVGVGVAVVSGGLVHWLQKRRARVLPYLPSHEAAVVGERDDAVRFFAAVHEMTMAVTDAWNAVRARRASGGTVEGTLKRDALLPACDRVLAEEAALRGRLEEYVPVVECAQDVRGGIDAVWDYRTRDNYRTETYTVSTTDEDGNTTTEVRTRQVYENTDHWFTFHADAARAARRAVDGLADLVAASTLPIPDVKRVRVDVDRIGQAERMLLERMVRQTVLEDDDAEVSEAVLSETVNQWILGSRLGADLQELRRKLTELDATRVDAFATILSAEPSTHYRTTSRSHSGPPGYQAAQGVDGLLDKAEAAWGRVDTMLTTCADAAGDLSSWAEDPEEIESDLEYGRRAVAAYEAAFPDSTLEVDQLPRAWGTALVGILAGLVAGGLTYAVQVY